MGRFQLRLWHVVLGMLLLGAALGQAGRIAFAPQYPVPEDAIWTGRTKAGRYDVSVSVCGAQVFMTHNPQRFRVIVTDGYGHSLGEASYIGEIFAGAELTPAGVVVTMDDRLTAVIRTYQLQPDGSLNLVCTQHDFRAFAPEPYEEVGSRSFNGIQ